MPVWLRAIPVQQSCGTRHHASRIALEEGPFIILARKPIFLGMSTRISGVEEDDFRGAGEGSFQIQDWWISA